jgi:hypothetical protein
MLLAPGIACWHLMRDIRKQAVVKSGAIAQLPPPAKLGTNTANPIFIHWSVPDDVGGTSLIVDIAH